MKYLLDTNIVSQPFKVKPDPRAAAKLAQHQGEIAIAATSWHELHYGMLRLPPSSKRSALERFLRVVRETMPILPYDEAAALWHASERARLYQRTPPYRDGEIAAVAAANALVLVTDNLADYSPFKGLKVENWIG